MIRSLSALLVVFCCSVVVPCAHPQNPNSGTVHKDPVMTHHAEGTFDVKMTPLPADDAAAGAPISRYSGVKQFHGDLDGTSKVEMLAAGDPAKGAAGYVAIEYVTGSLQGHTGSFALQHLGTMEGGSNKLSINVVPGTGTGELTGIAGTFNIVIASGKHSYTFDYTLPAAAQ
jgi:hypothetical protein